MGVLAFLFWLTSGLFLSVTIFFLLEIIAAWKHSKNYSVISNFCPNLSVSAKAVFIIPAHNEEDVLSATLQSICPQLREGDNIIVVADNCSDSTAQIARSFNVCVLERFDDNNKGKGFALDFALSNIADESYDVIVMIDADCMLEENSRDLLVEQTLLQNCPIQCLYLMHTKSDSPSVGQKISEFAWLIKNKLRPMGLLAMGGPCHLMGTGMAFPAKILNDIDMANGCIVEDMKLGLDLALIGKPPKFLPQIKVWSYFPTSDESSDGQKSRWIHGHLEMIFLYVPKLLKAAFLKRDFNLLLLCYELLVPPLVLLLMICIGLFFIACVLSVFLGLNILVFSLSSIFCLGLALLLSWILEGRLIVSFSELIAGLFSRLKLSSVYVKFFTDRRKDWNKTSRK